MQRGQATCQHQTIVHLQDHVRTLQCYEQQYWSTAYGVWIHTWLQQHQAVLAVTAPCSLSCNVYAKLSNKLFQNMSFISPSRHGLGQDHCSRTAKRPHVSVQAFIVTWVLSAPCVHMCALVCATVCKLWSIYVCEEYVSPSRGGS